MNEKRLEGFFDDAEYYSRLFSVNTLQGSNNEISRQNALSDGRLHEAYKQTADIRKFEIELFWKRGTYYWAFILAAFTAHFALLGLIFSTFSENVNKELSLKNMCELPGLSLFLLAVTAFFCFFFSIAWTLVNKGSKFWQKNWEAHIDMLEENVTGKLYETFLNTNFRGEGEKFSKNPLCYKAYDYSVTKITTLTSILLTFAAGFLFLFYVILFFFKWRKEYVQFCEDFIYIAVPIGLLVMSCLVVKYLLVRCIGNDFANEINTTKRWYQRPKIDVNKDKT